MPFMIHALYHDPDGTAPEYVSEGVQFQGEFLYNEDILFFFCELNAVEHFFSEVVSCYFRKSEF